MKKTFFALWQNFLANPDIYIIVAVAIPTAVLSLLGITNLNLVLSIVLATVALVSMSLLTNRRENSKIQHILSTLETTASSSEKFFVEEFDFLSISKLITDASSAYLFGLGFTALIPILHDYLSHKGTGNLSMKFLLMEPRGNSVKVAAFREDRPVKDVMDTYIRNIAIVNDLVQKSIGKFECKVIDYLPPYNIIAINPHLPSGRIFVHLAAWRVGTTGRPLFELSKQKDQKWFEYFDKQFGDMWKVSSEYSVQQTTHA